MYLSSMSPVLMVDMARVKAYWSSPGVVDSLQGRETETRNPPPHMVMEAGDGLEHVATDFGGLE